MRDFKSGPLLRIGHDRFLETRREGGSARVVIDGLGFGHSELVIGVPDSATAAAVGYSQESGIPFGEGLIKNRYVGRTFILPDQRLRELGVRRKLNPLPELIRDKRIVVVDDSIVRGTTTPHVVRLLKNGGAGEVHMRVCAPPIMWPCHFGIDLATRKELLAANMSVEEIREYVGADSLGYLSHEGLLKAEEAKQEANQDTALGRIQKRVEALQAGTGGNTELLNEIRSLSGKVDVLKSEVERLRDQGKD